VTKFRAEISVAEFNQHSRGCLPDYVGIETLELSEGSMRSRMPVKQLHFAPSDFLHAASAVALADTTRGYATIAHLPEGISSVATIELNSNHLGTVREGTHFLRHDGSTPGGNLRRFGTRW
jgi:uncharacterized protein (TIGR00369 family)